MRRQDFRIKSMNVLLGTTNPSKVKRFENMLEGYDVEFITLSDRDIWQEPKEIGRTPLENAKIKAEFYGRYADFVISNDSGLYIDDLSMEDVRQPGLHIRSPQGRHLEDEEMIIYYSNLVRSLGGRVLCYYLDGMAVYRKGKIFGFMEDRENAKTHAFYLVSEIHPNRHPGWPLDSISINQATGTYFVEESGDRKGGSGNASIFGEYREKLISFLVSSLSARKK